MSQYPSPYPPAPYGQPPIDYSHFAPPGDLLAPARRAAALQAGLAGLVLLCGVCLGSVPWVMDMGALIAQSGMTLPQAPPGVSLEAMLRTAYTVIGVVGCLIGVGLLVLSLFVRRGGAAPAVTSIVLEAAVVLVLLLNLASSVFQLASNPAAGMLAILILAVLLGAFGLNITWLVAAIRNAAQVRAARDQYAAQYQNLYQQQQAYYAQPGQYAGTSYAPQGYGYPAGPAAQQSGQVAPPPPGDAPREGRGDSDDRAGADSPRGA